MRHVMENKIYAVIDTNVIVSALISQRVNSYPLTILSYYYWIIFEIPACAGRTKAIKKGPANGSLWSRYQSILFEGEDDAAALGSLGHSVVTDSGDAFELSGRNAESHQGVLHSLDAVLGKPLVVLSGTGLVG